MPDRAENRRRLRVRWIAYASLFVVVSLYFGAGNWGWWGGGLPDAEEISALPEESAPELARKRDLWALLAKSNQDPAQQTRAKAEQDRLDGILEAWAGDHARVLGNQVDALLKDGKSSDALDLIDKVPAAYLKTSSGPTFEELRQRATSP